MAHTYDTLVIGGGIAGLTYALQMAQSGSVAVLSKREICEANTRYAQGGIATVWDDKDTFDAHIRDTIVAGDQLNHPDIVRICVEDGPDRVRELIAHGVAFTRKPDDSLHLTREGGHSARRVLHAKDMTGAAVQDALVEATRRHPNITVFEDHHAVDLITRRRLGMSGDDRCLGAYVLDLKTNNVETFLGRVVMLATGGAGKVYLYTSNPDIATGDGIAMAWRAGVPIVNMEFYQFHPTCLYHPDAKNFLVTEACRGEGGILRRQDGVAFMANYHPMKDLAPRDIVARAIDSELKRTGDECVYLDMTHLPAAKLESHFPGVMAKLESFAIDMRTTPIPIVPAAHYCCGGVRSDAWGRTGLMGLLVAGEASHTGLHGANRLASNSLLEGMVFGHRAASLAREQQAESVSAMNPAVPDWSPGSARDPDENVLIAHAWGEIRRLMWNYVGIVRSDKRLLRAKRRLQVIIQEVKDDYWNFTLTRDLIELRNIARVAQLIVESALIRRESRGLHYTLDYPERNDADWQRDTVLQRGRRG